MRALFVTTLLLLAATADAGKPKPAAAKAAVIAFNKALVKANEGKKPDFEPVRKLTGTPFRVLVDDGDKVCDTTAKDRATLDSALECASKGDLGGAFKPYDKKILKALWTTLKEHKGEIEELAKTHALYMHEAHGEDIHVVTIIAVTLDADGTARVAAMFSAELTT